MTDDPLWLAVRYLVMRARGRVQAARAGDPEAGSLTVELAFIAAALVAMALAAALVFRAKLTAELSKIG